MFIEHLEGRTLFAAATLATGIRVDATTSSASLFINIDTGVDVVRVSGSARNLAVKLNSDGAKSISTLIADAIRTKKLPAGTSNKVTKIEIRTGGGNDKIFLNVQDTGVSINAFGGAGRDLMITTGTSADTLRGEGNRDRLISITTNKTGVTPTITGMADPNVDIYEAIPRNVRPPVGGGKRDTLIGGTGDDQLEDVLQSQGPSPVTMRFDA
jgi:Ca2+-binding RTX toxin-like protein